MIFRSSPHRGARRSWSRLGALCFAAALPGLSACSTTRFHERQKLADHAMVCDADAMLVYFRNKVEAAREGALGGFGGSSVGGCGCQ